MLKPNQYLFLELQASSAGTIEIENILSHKEAFIYETGYIDIKYLSNPNFKQVQKRGNKIICCDLGHNSKSELVETDCVYLEQRGYVMTKRLSNKKFIYLIDMYHKDMLHIKRNFNLEKILT